MEEKKNELRATIDKLYGLIQWFGAYSPMATEIENSCHLLTEALEQHEI